MGAADGAGASASRAAVSQDAPVFLVGVDGVPADDLPAPLLPDQLMRGAGGLCLPDLGGLGARERLLLLGFQTLNPNWDGVAVITGEEASHWATLSAGEVIHHQGSHVPTMARALRCKGDVARGIETGMDAPERLTGLLFNAPDAAHRLGALIGADVGANRALWLGQQAVAIGGGPIASGYVSALEGLYVPVTRTDPNALIREGFRALARKFLKP